MHRIRSMPMMMLAFIVAALLAGSGPLTAQAVSQQSSPAPPAFNPIDPTATLAEMFSVACRQDAGRFPEYLTQTNAAFYKQLPNEQQIGLLRRLVQLQDAGRALLTTDSSHRTVVRCETPSLTAQIHIGTPRVDQNIAFVPVELTPDRKVDFGMVLNSNGWKFISLGLLMIDLPQLAAEWAVQDMGTREDAAMTAMRKVAAAIDTYNKAFEKLPDSLAQLGPAPKEGISDEAAGLLDAELAAGRAGGYALRYRVVPSGEEGKESRFELGASPTQYGTTGRRSFFIDSSGKMRGADKQGAPATAADPTIEESSSVH
ncbi:MAG: hypothetical protein WAM91_18045 [Candidatus Acidiferrales bacterium]